MVFGPGAVVVATRPDHLGTVEIEVWSGRGYEPNPDSTLIGQGELSVGRSGLTVGSVVGNDLRPIGLGEGLHPVRVYVRKRPEGPTAVALVFDPPGRL